MDGSRFDDFARAFVTSRRGALKTILGGAATRVASVLPHEATVDAAPAVQAADQRRNTFRRAGKRCIFGLQCGRLAPCTGGFCTPIACSIGGSIHQAGEVNPDNHCQVCAPTRDAWTTWENAGDGEPCESADGDPCLVATGECLFGECVRDMQPNGTACGPNQVCCSGSCCESDEGCGVFGCEAVDAGCLILGNPYDDGAANPGNPCEVCDPSKNVGTWSDKADNAPCADNPDRLCCRGICCGDGECCNASGTCVDCPVDCTIDGHDYTDGDGNPANPCLVCDSSRSKDAWSPASTDTRCGDNGDQCCNGAGNCDICDPDCVIDGKGHYASAVAPGGCAICDPSRSTSAWTPLDDNLRCGESADRFCCNGDCCDLGACCNEARACEVLGSPVCADCWIDGVGYRDGDPNPDADCQICGPSRSDSTWSEADDDSPCGANGDQFCCAGVCCPPAECCTPQGTCDRCECSTEAGAAGLRASLTGACDICCNGLCCSPDECCGDDGLCGPCAPGCTIDGVHYDDGVRNPRDFCQVCNADYPTQWSPRFHPDCPPPCTIDGILYAYDTVNPDNPCQRCRGGSSWSPSAALFCDDAQERVCCNGACCNPGECCSEAGTCGGDACDPEGCTIGGVQYADGTVNPDNVCQRCDEAVSKTSWSPNGIGHCGPNGDQWCCDGVCCALGDCCNQGACDPNLCETCAIDGVLYNTGDRNPANPCQVCDKGVSKTSWSLVGANFYCDDNQDRVCCQGICCAVGQACLSESGDHCGTL